MKLRKPPLSLGTATILIFLLLGCSEDVAVILTGQCSNPADFSGKWDVTEVFTKDACFSGTKVGGTRVSGFVLTQDSGSCDVSATALQLFGDICFSSSSSIGSVSSDVVTLSGPFSENNSAGCEISGNREIAGVILPDGTIVGTNTFTGSSGSSGCGVLPLPCIIETSITMKNCAGFSSIACTICTGP